jgi:hypothetical protein
VPDDLRIEGISRQAHSGITHDAARASIPSTSILSNAGANVNQREIAGAAAEIANEDEFVVIERRLIVMSGGHGLHLELYGFVARCAEGGAQSPLRIDVVVRALGSHKVNRPSDDGRLDLDSKLIFPQLSQVPKNSGDQVFQRVPPTEYLGAVKAATA